MSTIYEIVTFEETKQNEISKLREICKIKKEKIR